MSREDEAAAIAIPAPGAPTWATLSSLNLTGVSCCKNWCKEDDLSAGPLRELTGARQDVRPERRAAQQEPGRPDGGAWAGAARGDARAWEAWGAREAHAAGCKSLGRLGGLSGLQKSEWGGNGRGV